MRESLERVGRFDPARARERFAKSFVPAFCRKIVHQGQIIGFFTLAINEKALVLEHLYILPASQSQGIGAHVLSIVFREARVLGLPVRVGALRGSRSNTFYVRNGFCLVEQTEFDNYYSKSQGST